MLQLLLLLLQLLSLLPLSPFLLLLHLLLQSLRYRSLQLRARARQTRLGKHWATASSDPPKLRLKLPPFDVCAYVNLIMPS